MYKFFAVTTLFAAVAFGDPLSGSERIPTFSAYSSHIMSHGKAMINMVPSLVSIGYRENPDDKNSEYHHVCSGVIISDFWVLTSAHCIDDDDEIYSVNTVVAGATNYLTNGSRHVIDEKFLHPNYAIVLGERNVAYFNDIALVRMLSSFDWDLTRQPVRSYNQDPLTLQGKLTTFGCWGGKNSEERPRNFRPGRIAILPEKTCNQYLAKELEVLEDFGNGRGLICALYRNDAARCDDDSGFPLVMDNGLLVGIASWNTNSGVNSRLPVIFTAVGHYRDWIKETTRIRITLRHP